MVALGSQAADMFGKDEGDRAFNTRGGDGCCLGGQYGCIKVRCSGRTELVIDSGEDGAPEVRLLVHEDTWLV